MPEGTSAQKLVVEEVIKTEEIKKPFGGLPSKEETKIPPPPAFFNRPPTKLP
jgi:transcription initiation factor TFIID TATA-box-binding protein